MTDYRQRQPRARRTQGGGLGWKSGLVASSVGAVLMGWALLGRVDATPASTAAQIASPQPRVIIVQVPVSAPAASGNQRLVRQTVLPVQANTQAAPALSVPVAARPQIDLPAMPQKPVFQQPVTRTRRS